MTKPTRYILLAAALLILAFARCEDVGRGPVEKINTAREIYLD